DAATIDADVRAVIPRRDDASQAPRSSAIERFDLPLEGDEEGPALAVERLARGHLDPPFAQAVLLDVEALLAVEADADAVLEHRSEVMRAARIDRQAVRQRRRRRGRRGIAHLTRSAPALHAAASWSPVPPLQPIAPIMRPASTRGRPPGEATMVGSSV